MRKFGHGLFVTKDYKLLWQLNEAALMGVLFTLKSAPQTWSLILNPPWYGQWLMIYLSNANF